MTDFTHTSFEDIEPAGLEGVVEARMARGKTEAQQVGVSRFRYTPNARAPYGHHHVVQEEVYVVVDGAGRMKLDDEIIDLKQWDVVRVAPAVIRSIEAGPDGIDLIVAGGERPAEGDGELDKDFWP